MSTLGLLERRLAIETVNALSPGRQAGMDGWMQAAMKGRCRSAETTADMGAASAD